DPDRPSWAGNFFTGMPAPAGAITVLLPIYVEFLGVPRLAVVAPVTLIYTLAIAFLMVSKVPVYSGKKFGTRVPPDMVLPVILCVIVFFALLVGYPWAVLTIGTLCYLAILPFGWLSYRDYERRDAEAAVAAAADTAPQPAPPVAAPGDQPPTPAPDDVRPARLN
ncbi:MAG TPA: CDP-diacylglycerol--serine O-phosphatidyltransferase, partial [Bradyrhizobium sp.]|nr:CDP-diacylglycerol--serine O-phosphatidyltransferase [Bradyrhizobium sp.]